MAKDQKVFSLEEIRQKESRIDELLDNENKTAEEKAELKELRTEVKQAWDDKTTELASDAKLAKYKANEAQLKIQEFEEKLNKDKDDDKKDPVVINKETVEYNGQKFYTNKTLQQMVEANQISVEDANAHATQRDEERIATKVEERLKQKTTKEDFERQRREDWESVKKKYPHFDKTHPDFDADDPLYKEANELFMAGLSNSPRGLSMAIEKAERILGKTKPSLDVSDDLNVSIGDTSGTRTSEKEIVLTEDEKRMAVSQFRNIVNPKTNKYYTPDDAVTKALKAKKDRLLNRAAGAR